MKIHRFFLEQPLGEELIIKEKTLIHQWNNVLKFKLKERIKLFNSSLLGFDFVYEIKDINKNQISLSYLEKVENLIQSKEVKKINLCVSLIKKENFDLILEKCTEIGVFEFTPIISERTEKKNISSFNINRSKNIIKEAVEQSGWGIIPLLNREEKLESFLKNNKNILIMDIFNKKTINTKDNSINTENIDKLNILIGPEGGWTENERNLFNKYNITIDTFGKNSLRTETAAILSAYKFTS